MELSDGDLDCGKIETAQKRLYMLAKLSIMGFRTFQLQLG